MRRAFCAVALLALACLLIRAARVGLAGDYVDPVARITMGDESLYSHGAIQMAVHGGWLTPMFMGRYALYKPPLLLWLAAASCRAFGVSHFSLAFPVALFCAFGVGFVFLWAAEMRTWEAGACAALLLASNHMWHVLGGTCMTDGLLVTFYIVSMYCLFSDPWLESKWALWGFAGSVAAAILDKTVAGALPLGVLGFYWLAAPRKEKPSFRRLCLAVGLTLALAAPWFLYQLFIHRRWFWVQHIGIEILGFGAGAPPQTSQENQLLFYLMRIPLIDPVLTAAALVSIPSFFMALRKRSGPAVLLACWILVVLASAFGWQYRNISYIMPMFPALAIVAMVYGPLSQVRPAWWMIALAAGAFVLKTASPSAPWGLSFEGGTVQPVAPLISTYCERGRSNELIVVGMDDDLYASAMPLPKVRYLLVQPPTVDGPYEMPFVQMGIIISAAQFDDYGRWAPVFRERLRSWGLDSPAPIGTLIEAGTPEELGRVVAAHPDSDFLVPDRYRGAVVSPSHVMVEAPPGHFFLLARQSRSRQGLPEWACRL
jgi:hypothetical protein